ncbi:MAG: L,D-transpeptidase family protein, partial [Blautia sp.]|nr:L,D-transpeptidase family protein [Blautia sp.]
GVPTTGDYVSGDAQYYFDTNKNAAGIPGRMYTGWLSQNSNKRWRYYDKTTGVRSFPYVVVKQLDTKVMGSGYYLLDKNGNIQKKKLLKAKDGYYYISKSDGTVYKNAVFKFNGAYYAADKKAHIITNKLVKHDGARYYFGKDGKKASYTNGWYKCKGAGNRYYYFGKTPGKVVEKKGWQLIKVGGKAKGWFYFSKSGNHYLDKWDGSKNYYFLPNGRLASGLQDVGGKTYFFKVSTEQNRYGKLVKSQYITYKGKHYVTNSNGVVYKNKWAKVDGNYYYLQADGSALVNDWIQKDGKWGYCDASGKLCTGWVIENSALNKVKYINPNQKGFYTNTTVWIDGKQYRFDSNGYRVNDRRSEFKRSSYYLECDRVNCVMTIYTDSSKTIPIWSQRVSVGQPGTPTPLLTNQTIHASDRWQLLMGPSWGQYGTHVYEGIFIHSIPCTNPNPYNVPASAYNLLGNPASHGCIRMTVEATKWIYYNCSGSKLTIFDGQSVYYNAFKGPLGKPPLIKINGNVDPTDVDALKK